MGHLGIHGRAEDHQRSGVEIHQRSDELLRSKHRPSDEIARPVHEFRERVDHHVGPLLDRRDRERREGVVDDQLRTMRVRDGRDGRNVRDPQRRIRE